MSMLPKSQSLIWQYVHPRNLYLHLTLIQWRKHCRDKNNKNHEINIKKGVVVQYSFVSINFHSFHFAVVCTKDHNYIVVCSIWWIVHVEYWNSIRVFVLVCLSFTISRVHKSNTLNKSNVLQQVNNGIDYISTTRLNKEVILHFIIRLKVSFIELVNKFFLSANWNELRFWE